MGTLKDIATGWYNFIVGGQDVKRMMQKRLAICDMCPNKRQVSQFGVAIIHALNEEGSTFKCGLCGCPLAGLTANPLSECQDGKWKAEGTNSIESYF